MDKGRAVSGMCMRYQTVRGGGEVERAYQVDHGADEYVGHNHGVLQPHMTHE